MYMKRESFFSFPTNKERDILRFSSSPLSVEVDLNVTRNLKRDLSLLYPFPPSPPSPSPSSLSSPSDSAIQSAWHLLIGHYLGLDHIGHLGGDADPRISPKLAEMDAIIQLAYSSLFPSSPYPSSPYPSLPSSSSTFPSSSSSRSLLVIASDHGMTERGTHGGSTEKETDAFLAFLSPELGLRERGGEGRGGGERDRGGERERGGEEQDEMEERKGMERVSQLDFAATVACLMGVAVPRRSEGRVLLSPLSLLGAPLSLFCSLENALQLLRLKETSEEIELLLANALDRSLALHDVCLSCSPAPLSPSHLSPSSLSSPPPPSFNSSSDSFSLSSPLCLSVCRDAIESYSSLLQLLSSSSPPSLSPHNPVYFITVTGVCAVSLYSLTQLFSHGGLTPSLSFYPLFLLFSFSCKIFHFLSLFSSSLVEEEHQTFHFIAPSFFLLFLLHLFLSSSSRRSLSLRPLPLIPILLHILTLLAYQQVLHTSSSSSRFTPSRANGRPPG